MRAQCNPEQLQFSCVKRRRVVAAFDGGTVSSDTGALPTPPELQHALVQSGSVSDSDDV